jgi:membrane protease YdiL (CAAX protease family)
MTTIPVIGLLLALLGAPLVLVTLRLTGGEPFSVWSRLLLWGLAGAVLAIAIASYEDWPATIGLVALGWQSLGAALIAAVLMLAGWPATQLVQRKLGGSAAGATESFKKIAALPFWYRVFLVLTAAITEEVLYRGYGIGVGKLLFGDTSVALVISLFAFVAAHFRWGLGHLLPVLWAGAVLSALFALTNSLMACILAHLLVDAFGFLLAPYLIAMRSKRAQPLTGEA